ncbi:ankyrin repeat protein, partial [Ancylostoma caninum]
PANLDYVKDATKYDPKSVDARDAFGCTPCAYAVQGGNVEVVRYLVEKAHAEIGSVSRRGQSLLHIASLCGHEEIVRWILNRSGTNVILWTTLDNANAIHCAAYSGSVPVLRLLLRPWSRKKRKTVLGLQDCRGNTPLHLAAMNGHSDAVVYLLESEANPLAVNGCGYSPQAIANMRGNPQMATFIAGFNAKNQQPGSLRTPLVVETQHLPTERCYSVPLSPVVKRTLSPRDSSSGYSSTAEFGVESPNEGAEIIRQRMKVMEDQQNSPTIQIELEDDGAEVIRRRMRYIEDDTNSLRDSAAQTDSDSLVDHIQILDDETWAGMGLSAVEHIDRVLDEIDLN